MKKIFGISLVAALAVLPLAANAHDIPSSISGVSSEEVCASQLGGSFSMSSYYDCTNPNNYMYCEYDGACMVSKKTCEANGYTWYDIPDGQVEMAGHISFCRAPHQCSRVDSDGIYGSGGLESGFTSSDACLGVSNNSTPELFRVASATHSASENILASGAYAKDAHNANVGNINTALEYIEDSSVATINSAKVSADNVSLTVNGFTPSGTVSVNSSNATVSGKFNVPTTVALMDEWGETTTTNATLGGIQQANITNGEISGLSATFTGTASGNLSGTGSFNNASVNVTNWIPVNPS